MEHVPLQNIQSDRFLKTFRLHAYHRKAYHIFVPIVTKSILGIVATNYNNAKTQQTSSVELQYCPCCTNTTIHDHDVKRRERYDTRIISLQNIRS